MSDPMTNIEIEDVLSSIRRLVSEDHRMPSRPAAKPEAAGKLVLTPALRIVPEERAPAMVPEIALAEPLPADPTPSHKAAAAVMEQALSGSAEDWEPEGTEEKTWAVEWAEETVDAETVSANVELAGEPVEPKAAASIQIVSVEAEPAEAEPVATAEPDQPKAEPATTPTDADTAFVEAVEDEFLIDEGADPLLDLDDELSEPLVDEEAIRDIVREILREELQGALGERITRNVRKLVRAEINRALAARDLG